MVAYAFIFDGLYFDGAYAASNGTSTLDITRRATATKTRILLLNWRHQDFSAFPPICPGDDDDDDDDDDDPLEISIKLLLMVFMATGFFQSNGVSAS